MSGGVSLGRYFEERENDVTLDSNGGLGWAWLAPLIQGVMGANQGGSSILVQQQQLYAQQRAAAEASRSRTVILTSLGVFGFLALGAYGLYVLSKKP